MFSGCGYSVQSVRTSGFISCSSLSTETPFAIIHSNQAYGNVLVSHCLTKNNPPTFTQAKNTVFNLLKQLFSPQSTQPITTTNKELKEI